MALSLLCRFLSFCSVLFKSTFAFNLIATFEIIGFSLIIFHRYSWWNQTYLWCSLLRSFTVLLQICVLIILLHYADEITTLHMRFFLVCDSLKDLLFNVFLWNTSSNIWFCFRYTPSRIFWLSDCFFPSRLFLDQGCITTELCWIKSLFILLWVQSCSEVSSSFV